jgi:hypothetical protein
MWVIENARATAAMKECWKHRLQVLKKDLGYDDAPLLEKLLIQQAALCWLKLNLVELSYSGTMAQSVTLTLGMYWEKRIVKTLYFFDLPAREAFQSNDPPAVSSTCAESSLLFRLNDCHQFPDTTARARSAPRQSQV